MDEHLKNHFIDRYIKILTVEKRHQLDFLRESHGFFYNHNELIDQIKLLVAQLNELELVNLFLASLSTRNLFWRKGLSDYLIGKNMPLHEFVPFSEGDNISCGICSCSKENTWFSINFTIWCHLNVAVENKKVVPNKEDVKIFNTIIKTILSQPSFAKASDLQSALSGLFKSNSYERQYLIGNLGKIGLLETEFHKGYFNNFNTCWQINHYDKHIRSDWEYPVNWWRGENGINKTVLEYYFKPYLDDENMAFC